MKSLLMNRIGRILLTSILFGSLVGPLHAITYTLTDLGDLPGGMNIKAYGINESGQIVGSYYYPSNHTTRIFLWTKEKGMQDIGVSGNPDNTCAGAINGSGQVVGLRGDANGCRAFLWTSGSGIQYLDFLPSAPITSRYSVASAINQSGQIVGESSSANGYRAVLWTSKLEIQDLGVLPDVPSWGGCSSADAINNLGQVAGSSYCSEASDMRAFLWTSGSGMQNLGVLPGGGGSYALGINDSGQVVGYSGSSIGSKAFLWTKEKGIQDLGVLPGGSDFGRAYDINASGQVVGLSSTATRNSPFLWTSGSGMLDLNNLLNASGNGWTLSDARAINDNGQICGYGTYNGMTRAFLLTPVPEPSAFLLLAAAGGCAFVWNRRRALRS